MTCSTTTTVTRSSAPADELDHLAQLHDSEPGIDSSSMSSRGSMASAIETSSRFLSEIVSASAL